MSTPVDPKTLLRSQKIFERLLGAYPKAHRKEYGAAMSQLFRDQCRDAWNGAGRWGLTKLWLRVLPDLVKSSALEHLLALKERKFMSGIISALLRPRSSAWYAFRVAFVTVFVLVVGVSTLITFLLPESYASTARIRVEPGPGSAAESATSSKPTPSYDPYFIQTTFEIIQDRVVLEKVIKDLDLNVVWGKKYNGGIALKTDETMELLKRRMNLTPVRNASLISITVYSEDKNDAARIANAIAQSYRDYRFNQLKQLSLNGIKTLEDQWQQEESQISKLEIETRYMKTEKQLTALQALSTNKLRDVLPTVVPDTALSDLLNKLYEAEQTCAALTNDYSPADSHITRVQSLKDELNRQIDVRVAGLLAGLENQARSEKAQLDTLTTSLDKAKANDQAEADRGQPYWVKQRELSNRLEFHKLLAARIETERSDLMSPKTSVAEIIVPAQPGLTPARPNKPLNITLGAIAGIFLASVAGAVSALIAFQLGKRRRNSPGLSVS
jgi:polysaccharide biosynthesis transport protein